MGTEGLLGGRYRLDRIAGHGGMATVFVAFDTVLEREVAIKLLQRRRDEGGILHERFRREALAAAKVVHPNVVTVHDVGQNDEGRPYIVMDYVVGAPLATLLAEGGLPSERVAVLGVGIARALAAAHGLGILHRDVKPANILVDDQGIPHLTDFGLARARDRSDVDLTAPGSLLGTAHYVAPEQARHGDSAPASDLYSLGAVLYHALAGEPPFTGNGAIDVALRRFEEDPPALSTRVAGADTDLTLLVHALLERDPAARPADAESVAERLGDIAARLRAQRTGGDATGPSAVGIALQPAAATVAAVAPEIPQPNNSSLPPLQWAPGEAGLPPAP